MTKVYVVIGGFHHEGLGDNSINVFLDLTRAYYYREELAKDYGYALVEEREVS